MKNKKFIKSMLLIIIISLLFIIIRTTYSKYVSSQDDSAKLGISKWNLLINDQNIINNSNFTETLEIVLDENENIAQNVIVPKYCSKCGCPYFYWTFRYCIRINRH